MKYTEQVIAVKDYFLNSEKETSGFLIGAELEFFLLERKTGRTVSYYEDRGVRSLLEILIHKGFIPIVDGEDIVGAAGKDLVITLEPGAQFEISLNPQRTLSELEEEYIKFMNLLKPELEERGQILYTAGYQPVSKIEDIPFIPKERYKYMAEYLHKQGCYALNMMKGTASIQVAIDYCSERDFTEKMLLASRLTPVLAAVYDNSAVFEGKEFEKHCLRTMIWNNCDDSRCGVIPQVFQPDFGYEKYAEYILDQIPIFVTGNNGMISFEQPFKEIFQMEINIRNQLEHIFSMCFPDVRARNYIEIRMVDTLPYPFNFAFIELIQKIFYDREVFASVKKIFDHVTFQDVNKAKADIIKQGVNGKLCGDKVISIFRKIMKLAGEGNSENFKLNHMIATSAKAPRELLQEENREF